MTASNQIIMQQNAIDGALMEKVILGNDLSGLTPLEKVKYVNGICRSLGLNPATNPIKLMKFQGKEIPYCSKDATEQLRKNNHVSILGIDTKIMDGIYIVTANASTPDGRSDSSTGVISIKGLSGDALANAMMKAETKAKRRVTLSICGLGFSDESEMESLRDTKKVNYDSHKQAEDHHKQLNHIEEIIEPSPSIEDMLKELDKAITPDGLAIIFKPFYKILIKNKDQDNLKILIEHKDKLKAEMEIEPETINIETGEVQNES